MLREEVQERVKGTVALDRVVDGVDRAFMFKYQARSRS